MKKTIVQSKQQRQLVIQKNAIKANNRDTISQLEEQTRLKQPNTKAKDNSQTKFQEKITVSQIRPQGYKTFSMLNSAEHEIYPADKC